MSNENGKKPVIGGKHQTPKMNQLLITMPPAALVQFEKIMKDKNWSKSMLLQEAMIAVSEKLNLETIRADRHLQYEGAPPEFLRPSQWDKETCVMSPAPGDEEVVSSVGVSEVYWGDGPEAIRANITCWDVDDNQLEFIKEHRKVYVTFAGERVPPHNVMVHDPIDDEHIRLAKEPLRS